MEIAVHVDESIDQRIAQRLKGLRAERSWPLDELASRSGVSRATLSRIENAEVSPTAMVLGKICTAFGITLSRLMMLAEEGFAPVVARKAQLVWQDPETGFTRRSVSPPAQRLTGEVVECELPPGIRISYAEPPRPGLEHHLLMLKGKLSITVDGVRHDLIAGDCLRYQLRGASLFETPDHSGAHYHLFMV
jgi:transcriptional regulator with XRE-family HTH domain